MSYRVVWNDHSRDGQPCRSNPIPDRAAAESHAETLRNLFTSETAATVRVEQTMNEKADR